MVITRRSPCSCRSYYLTQCFSLFQLLWKISLYLDSNNLDFCVGEKNARLYFILVILVHILLLVSMITPCLEVDHLGSTFIKDTSVGEIVLLDRVCRGFRLEIADRNLRDDFNS